MGTRSAVESLAQVFLAFVEQGTRTQSELATRVGIGARAVKKHLEALSKAPSSFPPLLPHPSRYCFPEPISTSSSSVNRGSPCPATACLPTITKRTRCEISTRKNSDQS
jgi:hypothetical protein